MVLFSYGYVPEKEKKDVWKRGEVRNERGRGTNEHGGNFQCAYKRGSELRGKD